METGTRLIKDPARDTSELRGSRSHDSLGGPNIVRFVSVLAKRLRALPLPLSLPSDDDWLLKIIAIQDRFVLGLYRRQMKAISYLGKIKKLLGVPVTTRNWNTIKKSRENSARQLTDRCAWVSTSRRSGPNLCRGDRLLRDPPQTGRQTQLG